MNPNGFKNTYTILSGFRFWIILLVIVWLISSIGLGWIVKSLFLLIGIFLLLPIIAVIGFQIWLRRSLCNGHCPVCDQTLIGLNNQNVQCTNCGEALVIKDKLFQRMTPPGTVDVDVVDVSVTELPPSN